MLHTHLLVSERAARDNDQVYRDEVQRTHACTMRRTVHRDRTADNTVSSLQPSSTGKRSREMRLGKSDASQESKSVDMQIFFFFFWQNTHFCRSRY